MLDLIQDQSTREIHDALRQHLACKHGEGSVHIQCFDSIVGACLEDEDERGLEDFLQSLWDSIE